MTMIIYEIENGERDSVFSERWKSGWNSRCGFIDIKRELIIIKSVSIYSVSTLLSSDEKGSRMGMLQIFSIPRFFRQSFLFYPKNPARICARTFLRTQIRE